MIYFTTLWAYLTRKIENPNIEPPWQTAKWLLIMQSLVTVGLGLGKEDSLTKALLQDFHGATLLSLIHI